MHIFINVLPLSHGFQFSLSFTLQFLINVSSFNFMFCSSYQFCNLFIFSISTSGFWEYSINIRFSAFPFSISRSFTVSKLMSGYKVPNHFLKREQKLLKFENRICSQNNELNCIIGVFGKLKRFLFLISVSLYICQFKAVRPLNQVRNDMRKVSPRCASILLHLCTVLLIIDVSNFHLKFLWVISF